MQKINKTVFLDKPLNDAEFEELQIELFVNRDLRTITISRELSLDTEFIKRLCEKCPKQKIKVYVPIWNYNQSAIFDQEELKVLYHNVSTLLKSGSNVSFVEDYEEIQKGYSFNEAITASRKVDDIVKTIKNAKVDGRELSPLEKYLYAYIYATEHEYNESGKDTSDERFESRSVVRILNGDKIVCVGYVSLLFEICKRLGIPLKQQFVTDNYRQKETVDFLNHANCSVFIEDEFYDVKTMFYSDPTRDANDPEIGRSIAHALIDFNDVNNIFDGKILVENTYQTQTDIMVGFMNDVRHRPHVKISEHPEIAVYAMQSPQIVEQLMKYPISAMETCDVKALRKKQAKTKAATGLVEREKFFEVNKPKLDAIYVKIFAQCENRTDETEKEIKEIIEDIFVSSDMDWSEMVGVLQNYCGYYNLTEQDVQKFAVGFEKMQYLESCLAYEDLKKKSSELEPEILYEAIKNVFKSMGHSELEACSMADKIFNGSVNSAAQYWTLDKSKSYFAEEALNEIARRKINQ